MKEVKSQSPKRASGHILVPDKVTLFCISKLILLGLSPVSCQNMGPVDALLLMYDQANIGDPQISDLIPPADESF